MCDPNPGSVSQDSAAPKTESPESNQETQAAQSGSQESVETAPERKGEGKGNCSSSSVDLSVSDYTDGFCVQILLMVPEQLVFCLCPNT